MPLSMRTSVKIHGVSGYKAGEDGKVELSNNDLPETATRGKGSITEPGKLSTEGTVEVEVPAKLKDSAVPKLVVEAQDPKTGNVTVKVTDQNGQPLASGTTVKIPGVSGDKAVVGRKYASDDADEQETAERGEGSITEPGKLSTEGTV